MIGFSKSLDKVSRIRLLQKFSPCEIDGKVSCWMADFLPDRKMRISTIEANIRNVLMLSAEFQKGRYSGA